MIDLHSHILPALDDGARTIEHSRALAVRAAADGVSAIAATPHVRHDYPTTAGQMEERVALLRADFEAHGIPVEILHGGEIDLALLPTLGTDELRRFTLAQSGRYLLVEFPYVGWPLVLEQAVFDLAALGIRAVLAHPERNREVQLDPARLRGAVEGGALVQLTAASVDGRLGRSPRQAADTLLELALAHLLASDAHTPDIREAGLAAAVALLGDAQVAAWLTEDVPAAIVAGREIPERPGAPAPRPRRKRFGLF